MKKIAGVIMAAVFVYAGLLTAQEYQGPRIEIKEMRHAFGKVVQGTQVSHVFDVMSVGDEALVIERVKTS